MSEQPPAQPPDQPPPGPPPPPAPPAGPPGAHPPAGPPPAAPRRAVPVLAVLAVAAVAVVAVGALLLVRQGDGELSADEQAYADAISASLDADDEDDVLSPEETRCVGQGAVESIGLETLRAAGTPEEVGESDNVDLDLTDEQGNAYYEAVDGCIDVRQLFLTSLQEEGLPPDTLDCIEGRLDDEMLRATVVADLTGDDQAADDASDALEEAMGPCQPPAG